MAEKGTGQPGFVVPFVFKGPGYSFTISPASASHGLSVEAVEATDRAKLLDAVAADQAAVNAQRTKAAADEAAGIFPF